MMNPISEKYPRTPHLPFSPGIGRDDVGMADVSGLLHRQIIITEKMDGSNVCLERGAVYARSHSASPTHPSFASLKALHSAIAYALPEGLQMFGEWLWAKHSIAYEKLPSFLLVFGCREREPKRWLPWSDTVAIADSIGLQLVPVRWVDLCADEEALRRVVLQQAQTSCYGDTSEGVVVRGADAFEDAEFTRYVAKYVRANYVQTTQHWQHGPIIRNQLAA